MNARHDAFAEQVRYLDSLGPRVTGSAAHGALVENVAEQLTGRNQGVVATPICCSVWRVANASRGVR
jgi:hypothetical protein